MLYGHNIDGFARTSEADTPAPLTAAGRAGRTSEATGKVDPVVQLTIGPESDLQRLVDQCYEECYGPAPEVYDYVQDGVVFDEAPDGAAPDDASESSPQADSTTPRFLRNWTGDEVLVPSGEVSKTDRGNHIATYGLQLTLQEPSETARRAIAALRLAGGAFKESVKEELKAEPKLDKESAGAVGYVCLRKIIEYSEHFSSDSRVDIVDELRKQHPKLPKDPNFRRVIGRFDKDADGTKRDFGNLNHEDIVAELPLITAFYEFCEFHGIDPKEVLEISYE